LSNMYVILDQRDEALLLEQVTKNLSEGLRLFYFRSAKNTPENLPFIKKTIDLIHSHQAKVLVSTEVLYKLCNADGVHFASRDLMNLTQRPETLSLMAASCHNERELQKAAELNCDFAVLSPVQATQSHPDATPLGWQAFEAMVKQVSIPVYALGGVNQEDLPKALLHGACGIAGIRAFMYA